MNYCKSDFGQKCLINALNITVNVNLHLTPPEPWNVLSTTNCPIFPKMTSLTLISQASGLSSLHWDGPFRSDSVLPEPRPSHLSSFSSTCLLCLTQSNQILLSTLAELWIAESALTWFTSYLTNRTFQVTWNDPLSKPCFLETGVPQDSVLGLLPFSLYTSSLGSAITSHGFSYHCYADDTRSDNAASYWL